MPYKKILLSVALLATVGFLFLTTAKPVKAVCDTACQTQITELTRQITALTAQLFDLQHQSGQTTPTTTTNTGTGTTWCHDFKTPLGFTNSGSPEVGQLHIAYDNQNISYVPDGKYDYKVATADATVKFQARYGISQTGYVGAKTLDQLTRLFGCSTTTPVTQDDGHIAFDPPAPPVSVSCYASASPVAINQQVTWFANPNGATGGTFQWSGDVTGTAPQITTSYPTSGARHATVVFTAPSGASATANCSVAVGTATNQLPISPITMTSPSVGEQWIQGSSHLITWTGGQYSDGTYPAIDITLYSASCNGDLDCIRLSGRNITSALLSNSFTWQVSRVEGTSVLVPPGNYFIQVCAGGEGNRAAELQCDVSDRVFTIVASASTTTPVLNITSVIGLRSSYSPGEQISFSVKGIETDGTPASNTEGFNVQAYVHRNGDYINYLPPNPTYSYNGNYNASTGLWDVTMIAPSDPTASYAMKITLYCSRPSNYYSTNNCDPNIVLVDRLINFTISSSTSTQPRITVSSPNGGERYTIGQTINIFYSSVGSAPASTVNLYLYNYATGATNNPITIASNLPISGNYSWTIPNTITPGTQFRVSAQSVQPGETGIIDYSDLNFIIASSSTTPSTDIPVAITANGHPGPVVSNIVAGSDVIIAWTPTVTVSSCVINSNVYSNTGLVAPYSVTIPHLTQLQTAFVITCYPLFANTPIGNTIVVNTTTSLLPIVTVTANGLSGPIVTAPSGSNVVLYWTTVNNVLTTTAATACAIHSTPQDPTIGSGISSLAAATGMSVHPTVNTTYTVTCVNPDGGTGSGSITVNTSLNPAQITVTSPNGGEQWSIGSDHNITWNSTGIQNINISFVAYTNGVPIGHNFIATVPASQGSYSWHIGDLDSNGHTYKILIADTGLVFSAYSNSFNILQTSSTPPTITVTSPNGGENWQIGTTHAITWSSTGINNTTGHFHISLIRGNPNAANAEFVIADTNNAGSYSWTVPATLQGEGPIPSQGYNIYKIRVYYMDGNSNAVTYTDSNNYFSITASVSATPTITVTSPNGGENWQIGTTHTVTWTSANLPAGATVSISVIDDDHGSVGPITGSTILASAGTYSWTVSSPIVATTRAKLSVGWNNAPSGVFVADNSENYFTIAAATLSCSGYANNSVVLNSMQASNGTVSFNLTNTTSSTQSVSVAIGSGSVSQSTISVPSGACATPASITYSTSSNTTITFTYSGQIISSLLVASTPQTTGVNVTVTRNSAYADQNVFPNTQGVKIGSFVINNASNSQLIRINSLTIGTTVGGGANVSNFSSLRVQANTGATSVPISFSGGTSTTSTDVIAMTNVAQMDLLGQGVSMTINIFANSGPAIGANVQTTLALSYAQVTNNVAGSISPVTGQTITFNNSSLATPTLVATDSTAAQNIAVGSNGVINGSRAVYNFVSNNGASVITELKFTVTGSDANPSNAITNICAAGVVAICAVPVNNVAYLTGLNLAVPNGGAGLTQTFSVSYAGVSASGLPSGTTSSIALTYVRYVSVGTTQTITPSVSAPTMTLLNSIYGLPSVALRDNNSTSLNGETIYAGTSRTLAWTGTNVSSCTASVNNSNASVPVLQGIAGSFPTGNLIIGTYVYTVTCQNTAGTQVSATYTITVSPAPGINLTANGQAGPVNFASGTDVTIAWTIPVPVSSCVINSNVYSQVNLIPPNNSVLIPHLTAASTAFIVTCYPVTPGPLPSSRIVVTTGPIGLNSRTLLIASIYTALAKLLEEMRLLRP